MEGSTYLPIEQSHVLDIRMFNNVLHARILAYATHADTVRVIAPEILDEYVGSIRLGSEAVITHIDTSIRDRQTISVKGVKPIRILGLGL